MRTIVDLPEDQVTGLAALCRRERLSRAEAVRRAVAAYLDAHSPAEHDEAFGMWRERKLDGLTYERNVRAEWT